MNKKEVKNGENFIQIVNNKSFNELSAFLESRPLRTEKQRETKWLFSEIWLAIGFLCEMSICAKSLIRANYGRCQKEVVKSGSRGSGGP